MVVTSAARDDHRRSLIDDPNHFTVESIIGDTSITRLRKDLVFSSRLQFDHVSAIAVWGLAAAGARRTSATRRAKCSRFKWFGD
jgi:hypothetical protein